MCLEKGGRSDALRNLILVFPFPGEGRVETHQYSECICVLIIEFMFEELIFI